MFAVLKKLSYNLYIRPFKFKASVTLISSPYHFMIYCKFELCCGVVWNGLALGC